jgi:hypothetical protein
MTNQITIYNIKVPTKREEVSNAENIKQLLANIEKLKDNVLTFDTKEQIKESKKFKTDANKFIKEFKEFCDPLEEEGKTIAKTRSQVKLALEKIVDDKLAPIIEREKKLQAIKDNLFIPSADAKSCELKLENLKALDGYDWFGLKDEALLGIQQSKVFFENELLGFEKAAKEKAEAEEKLRIEKENLIKEQAKLEAEKAAQAKIDEANRRAEQAEMKVEEVKKEVSQIKPIKYVATCDVKDRQNKARVHNEIVADLVNDWHYSEEEAKSLVRAIATNGIRNLFIQY